MYNGNQAVRERGRAVERKTIKTREGEKKEGRGIERMNVITRRHCDSPPPTSTAYHSYSLLSLHPIFTPLVHSNPSSLSLSLSRARSLAQ